MDVRLASEYLRDPLWQFLGELCGRFRPYGAKEANKRVLRADADGPHPIDLERMHDFRLRSNDSIRQLLRLVLLVAALPLAAIACSDAEVDTGPPVSRENPVVPLDTGMVLIVSGSDTVRVNVEIAETSTQREIGLMERTHLPENDGMIFLSEQENPAESGFWMFRTRIPLDIAHMDRDGRIVSIMRMEPCSSPYATGCPTYPARAPYWHSLEVNAGFFESRGIDIGDRVMLFDADGQQVVPAADI